MKKLLILVTALAMVACFMPQIAVGDRIPSPEPYKPPANDTASLNLKVTFDVEPEPIGGKLKIWIEPEGPFKVREGETIEFMVRATRESENEFFWVDLNVKDIPEGAEWVSFATDSKGYRDQYGMPIERACHGAGSFTWTSKEGQARKEPYTVVFKAESVHLITGCDTVDFATGKCLNYYNQMAIDATAELPVQIYVLPAEVEPVIAIALSDANLSLEGMKLGEVRNSSFTVKNTGNVPVAVDMGYSVAKAYVYLNAIRGNLVPGTVQDVNTYVTKINGKVISERIQLGEFPANAGTSAGTFELQFGAPTKLSGPVTEWHISYELRAYPAKDMEIVSYIGLGKPNVPVPIQATLTGEGIERIEMEMDNEPKE